MMGNRAKLFLKGRPFETSDTDAVFLSAMRENCIYQYYHCEEYKSILDGLGIAPADVCAFNHISDFPVLPTLVFKHHRIFSMSRSRMLVRATSSGTRGKRSEVGFEFSSLLSGLFMVKKIASWRHLISICPCNYVMLGYKPHRGNKTAVTKTAFGSTFFAPAIRRKYAIIFKDRQYEADIENIVEQIVRLSRSTFPIRFMGFPAYTYFALRRMDEEGLRLKLKKGSKIMLGGGWKQHYSEQVDKNTFYELADRVLGIKDEDIIEFFGAVEHPILYCDCQYHHFHIPRYGRVVIRDVDTLQPLPMGQVGLLNLLTPMVYATPILSVMTDDLAVLREGQTCPCGIKSPYVEIVGRVGLHDIKTCAAGAEDLIKEVAL